MDSVYDQVCWQQDPPDTGARSAQLRAEFLASFGPPERYAYGPSAVEGLDLYRTPAGKGNAPTMIYIHGGAWRGGSAAGSGSMAENFVSAGANLIALDFINVIQSGGNLITMAEQVRAGVAWVFQNAKNLGIDPNRIYVSGFSSGGHLCGVVITTDWAARGLPPNFIKGAVCGSGMYDLYPVSLSARNEYVNFNLDDTINRLSPIQHMQYINMPVVLSHGTKETPEFQRHQGFRSGARSRRQGRRADRRARVQPLRAQRNVREPLWSSRTRLAGTDGIATRRCVDLGAATKVIRSAAYGR